MKKPIISPLNFMKNAVCSILPNWLGSVTTSTFFILYRRAQLEKAGFSFFLWLPTA